MTSAMLDAVADLAVADLHDTSAVDTAATLDAVITHNLTQLNGPLIRFLRTESLGGNAGRVQLGARWYSCAAARGFADPRSGRIAAFGNFQDVPAEVRGENAEFILKVAFDGLRFFRIVQLFTRNEPGNIGLSANAQEAIESSIQAWNDTGIDMSKSQLATAEPKVIYWHRDLPPVEAAIMGEHTVEATSPRVSGTIAHGDELWQRSYDALMVQTRQRIQQEVLRLGGNYAHVLDESIDVRHDQAKGEAWLRGRFTYVLYRKPFAASRAV